MNRVRRRLPAPGQDKPVIDHAKTTPLSTNIRHGLFLLLGVTALFADVAACVQLDAQRRKYLKSNSILC